MMGITAAAYPLLTSVAASAAGSLVMGSLFGKEPSSAAPPAVTPPTAMPDAKTQSDAAARTSIAEQMRRRGRASTILTDTANAAEPLGA